MFDTKAEAIAAVNGHRACGARSIDVGCMQVNLMHHPDAFASLDEAFDPDANARIAAQFLQQLLAQTGSWPLAVAGYHSLTPEIGGDYAKKVLAIWAWPERANTMPDVSGEPRRTHPRHRHRHHPSPSWPATHRPCPRHCHPRRTCCRRRAVRRPS